MNYDFHHKSCNLYAIGKNKTHIMVKIIICVIVVP